MSKFYREIKVDGQLYQYRIGDGAIKFKKGNKTAVVGLPVFTGMNWNQIDMAKYNIDFVITPKSIADYIQKNPTLFK